MGDINIKVSLNNGGNTYLLKIVAMLLRPNFGLHLVFTSFHLEFSSLWVLRSSDLGDLGVLRMGTGIFLGKINTLKYEKQR